MDTNAGVNPDLQFKTIKLLATLRPLAGAREIMVPVSRATAVTVRDLLQSVRQAYPALGAYLLDVEGKLKPGIQCIVGGQHIDWQKGLDTPVAEGQDLVLMPPLAGG